MPRSFSPRFCASDHKSRASLRVCIGHANLREIWGFGWPGPGHWLARGPGGRSRGCWGEDLRGGFGGAAAVHRQVDDGGREEREHLGDDEAADDGEAEWAAELGAHAAAERERHRAEER